MASAGDDGSWVELGCGPGRAAAAARRSRSRQAEVERMLLEAQQEPESGGSPPLLLPLPPSAPARGDDGTGQASERPGDGDGELLPACGRPRPGCARPLQWDTPEEVERRERRSPASLAWARTRRHERRSPKEFAFVCSPQPALWSLQGGAVGRKKRLFSSEVLLLFIPSLLLSHLLTLGLGIYIGKRLAASSANPL
ncbi:BCL2/adenovirus E1B 19 kDa protein-interacting protein 3-like [Struthio camelus]|uniref:BCL2/adenovirus E1B 19 kDa protein-interacting protein 3-like n=1 Tax=Struthio camelus TaxID=8801 RepID=UPI0036041B0E